MSMLRLPLLALACIVAGVATAQPVVPFEGSDLKFDDLFPRKSYFGKAAREMAWSADERYIAYLWNPYDVRSFDLWLYDTKERKATRVTSIEMMAEYDRDARRAIGRYALDDRNEAERLKLDEKAYREAILKLRREQQERPNPEQGDYPGISEFTWANNSSEMVFVYRGDLFRWKVGDKEPTRLTRTRDAETSVQYMSDDAGFYFRRGDGVYRMRWDSAEIVQLNPALPLGMSLGDYSISPDGTKLMMSTGRNTGAYRQISWITYRGRFPQIRQTNQFWGTPDEGVKEERYLFLYDLNDDPKVNPDHDGKPWEVWSWKSDPNVDDVWSISYSDRPWSPDSKTFVFGTWKSKDKVLEVVTADLAARKTETVYKGTNNGEPSSPGFTRPFFTPNGAQIVATLEDTGFRQPWAIDPVLKSARPILKRGDFEAYAIAMSPDGRTLILSTDELHPGRPQVYRADFDSGETTRVTPQTGAYGVPTVSKSTDKMAYSFRSWSVMPEMYVWDGRETKITDSHRPGFMENVVKVRPEMFSYKNRHGQTIHGYMFLPPGFRPDGPKRPLMIYTYGGPLGQGNSVSDGDYNTTGFLFNMYLTYALGFVTVTIDPRGSSGYGAEFGRANFDNIGVPQTEDLTDGVKYLVENFNVDPERVALNGWSFGGWQTQHAMYTEPDVFTLGIAGAGPTEWQNYNAGYTEGVVGPAKTGSIAELDKFSLTKVAMNLKNPLLLLHGMEDDNVLFQHTIAVYRILMQYGLGPIVELSIDPTGGHGMGGDMNTRDRHAIYLAFILRHWNLGNKPGMR